MPYKFIESKWSIRESWILGKLHLAQYGGSLVAVLFGPWWNNYVHKKNRMTGDHKILFCESVWSHKLLSVGLPSINDKLYTGFGWLVVGVLRQYPWQRRYDCRSGSLPEVLQYRVWPVSRTETFNTQVLWPNLQRRYRAQPSVRN